jgi:hypothetical protein
MNNTTDPVKFYEEWIFIKQPDGTYTKPILRECDKEEIRRWFNYTKPIEEHNSVNYK